MWMSLLFYFLGWLYWEADYLRNLLEYYLMGTNCLRCSGGAGGCKGRSVE